MEKIPDLLDTEKAADLLMAMSNPKGLAILMLLLREEMAVGNLAEAVGLSQSALSQHLAKLRLPSLSQPAEMPKRCTIPAVRLK